MDGRLSTLYLKGGQKKAQTPVKNLHFRTILQVKLLHENRTNAKI